MNLMAHITSGPRYWLITPSGHVELPPTLKPSSLALTATASNLQRARGYRTIYDLADGIPDPQPFVLQGEVWFTSEAELSLYLRELHRAVHSATAFHRDERRIVAILSGNLDTAPSSTGHSGRAALTISLIPASVPDPADPDPHFW